jgi:hypothetical protein
MEPLRGDTRRPVNMIKPTKEREIDPYLGCIRTMSGKGQGFCFFGSAAERTQPGTRLASVTEKGEGSNGSESQTHSSRQVGSPGG